MFGRVRVLLNHCVQIWNERRPAQHAAALAYYSMFAFAPILYVVLRIAGSMSSRLVRHHDGGVESLVHRNTGTGPFAVHLLMQRSIFHWR